MCLYNRHYQDIINKGSVLANAKTTIYMFQIMLINFSPDFEQIMLDKIINIWSLSNSKGYSRQIIQDPSSFTYILIKSSIRSFQYQRIHNTKMLAHVYTMPSMALISCI